MTNFDAAFRPPVPPLPPRQDVVAEPLLTPPVPPQPKPDTPEPTPAPATDAPAKPDDKARGLPSYVVVMLGVAVTLGALLLMNQISGIIGPVFMAINLVIAAYPIHTWLRAKGTPAWLSASVMMLAVLVVLLFAVAGLVWSVSAMVAEVPKYSGQYMSLYNQVMDLLRHYGINTTGMSDIMQQISPNSVVSLLTSAFASASSVAGVVAAIIASLVFLAMDTPSMRNRMRTVSSSYPALSVSMGDFGNGIRRYWLTTTLFGAIIAVLDGVALFIMGVPLAAVWALLSFLTNYIPNIGFVIGLVPPALLALLGSGWQLMVGVIVVYCVLNFVIQTLIQPRIVGESVGVTATVSFVSLLLWGWVLGGLGTLLALPMTLLLKALFIDTDPKAEWLGALISSKPKPNTGKAASAAT